MHRVYPSRVAGSARTGVRRGDRLVSVIESEASVRRPVTAATDITTIPSHGDVEGTSMASGRKDIDLRAFKFATLSFIGQTIPMLSGVESIRATSE